MLASLLSAALAASLIILARRSPALGVAVLVAGFLASGQAVPIAHPPSFHLGPVTMKPNDLALLIVLTAYALQRALPGRDTARTPRPLLVLLGLLAVHTLRGVHAYGFQAALNQSRGWWWLLGATIYASTLRWDKQLVRVLAASGVALIATAVYGFATYGLSSADTVRYVDGEALTLRPLTAEGALFLLQLAAVLTFVQWRPRLVRAGFLLAVWPVLVLVQQRTVWIAALAIVPWLALQWLRRTHRVSAERGYAAFAAALFALPLVVWLVVRSHTLASSAAATQAGHSTWQWRLESWRALLGDLPFTGWLIGEPAGAGFARYIPGVGIATVQPHNLYVEALLRFGLPGLVAIVVLWLVVLRRVHDAKRLPWPRWVGYALVASEAIFAISYGPGMTEGIWLGLLIAVSYRFAPAPVTERAPALRHPPRHAQSRLA